MTSPKPKTRRRLVRWGLLTLLIGALLLLTACWTNLGQKPAGERLDRISQSPNYNAEKNRFANALRVQDPQLWSVLKAYIKGAANTTPDGPLPMFDATLDVLAKAPADNLRITWLGHATLLIEVDGARFLTDPVWAKRASPFSFMGPARFHEPPVAIEALPALDGVIISHDHYDHLDAAAIRALAPRVPRFYVPLGVGAHLEYWGVPPEKITELDWWDERTIKGVRLVATPSRHFSGRSVTDKNATLWASWAFVGPTKRAWFSGDTGMSPDFATIGQRLGPFDVTMVESGAYNHHWADVHLGPEQALQVHQAVRGRLMMPIHWGTFDLALHGWTEPVERLMVAAKAANVALAIPIPGQSVESTTPPLLARWWPELPWQTAETDPIVSSGLEPLALLPAPAP
jgi:L-ascorbate metabolism protein UlaG (beta-lactamase superfamily)